MKAIIQNSLKRKENEIDYTYSLINMVYDLKK